MTLICPRVPPEALNAADQFSTSNNFWDASPYQVQVPYTQSVVTNYVVEVPYSEQVTQKYTVQVPKWNLQLPGKQKLQTINFGGPKDIDRRERYFGAKFLDGPNGVVVTSVDSNSPASAFTRVGGLKSESFSFDINRDVVSHINGRNVNTAEEARKAIQDSHFIMDFRVSDPAQNRQGHFQTQLKLIQN